METGAGLPWYVGINILDGRQVAKQHPGALLLANILQANHAPSQLDISNVPQSLTTAFHVSNSCNVSRQYSVSTRFALASSRAMHNKPFRVDATKIRRVLPDFEYIPLKDSVKAAADSVVAMGLAAMKPSLSCCRAPGVRHSETGQSVVDARCLEVQKCHDVLCSSEVGLLQHLHFGRRLWYFAKQGRNSCFDLTSVCNSHSILLFMSYDYALCLSDSAEAWSQQARQLMKPFHTLM